MAHTYDELHQMTVSELREIAETQNADDVKGFKSLKKAQLLELMCKVLGVDAEEHHTARGIDKAAIKVQMRELRVARDAAIEAHNHNELRIVRRQIHRLNRKIRRTAA